MKGPRLNFHAEHELAGHLLAVVWYHMLYAPASDCLRLVLNRQARLPTLNSRNSTTNSSSTHQPTAALQIDQSLYHTWKLCRQPGFTACSARESTTTDRSGPMGRVHINIHTFIPERSAGSISDPRALSALEPFFRDFSAATPRFVARLAPSDSPRSRGPRPRAGPPLAAAVAQR